MRLLPRLFFFLLRAAVLQLVLAVPSAAQTPLVALSTTDAGREYAAVGRLDLGGRGFCTATLISDQLVLTAAHCLFDRTTQRRLPLADLSFQPGFRNGHAAAFRDVRRTAVDPDYNPGSEDAVTRVGADLALLELAQPIRVSGIAPIAVTPAARGISGVAMVSYAEQRSDVPALEPGCEVLAEEQRMQVLTCDVDFGSSGAPVIVLEGGAPRLSAVVSAKATLHGRKVALVGLVEDRVEMLTARLVSEVGVAPAPRQVGEVRLMHGGSSVKFLRP